MPRAAATDHLTRAGLNLIQQALSIYDADLRLAVCNRPFQTMFGLPEDLVTPGASFEDTIRWLVENGEYGDVPQPEAFVRDRVEAARAFVPHYMERRRANGRTISVEGSPLPEGGWVTVYTDISAVKRQEELLRGRSEELSDQLLSHAEELARTNRQLEATIAQLEEAKRELTEMEARIRLTTEMTPAHIARVDRDGVYTYTNRRLSTLLPDRGSDIVGLSFEEALGPVAGRLRPTLARALEGEASVLEFTEPTFGRRIRTAFTPDQTGPGEPVTGVYLLSTDVTEEAQARAALAQTHKRELAAQLTSGLAHDFANLLTIILGLQGRLEKMPLPEGARELTGATRTAARRGGLLLDKIARMSGPIEIRPAPVVLRDFLDSFTPLARAPLPPGIAFTAQTDVPHPAVMIDADSLQDSLLNLVLNARDAIGEGPGEIVLTLRAVRDTWLDIVVTDTGPGFTEAALGQALDPFFTTKGDEGSGLGLSMVYDMAKLAGGHVRLENRPEGGAAVTLRLPLKPAAAEARPQLVLLVEDMAELRASVRTTLTDLGHQVIEAASAEEALTLAEIPGLDWVISDLRLGQADGVDLLNTLATRAPGLRLALMTSAPETDPRRAEGALRWPVLGKPIEAPWLARLFSREDAA
ncbi:PAS-domain containing protein [Roseibacterium sp. SDUM158016]|uniref:hybrid sensor histidine kinase/response regulator n=1 Tax=Roseicyclus sediminis TaxID=2980997 RepID=UPI0021D1ED07|nr:PAS-domain containing protein [Roseibacterium sp. SDUM158016]MCU4651508.1 PAS-domain containing protein [Roseibacterium sp. SDUM158016]